MSIFVEQISFSIIFLRKKTPHNLQNQIYQNNLKTSQFYRT
jgi:hypothetical protein